MVDSKDTATLGDVIRAIEEYSNAEVESIGNVGTETKTRKYTEPQPTENAGTGSKAYKSGIRSVEKTKAQLTISWSNRDE